MNKVIEIGRIATDIDSRVSQNNVATATFKVAVNRRFKNAEGKREADFIPVVTWRQTAEFISRYGRKGDRVAVCGTIQTRNYTAQDGTKRYVTEIVADEVELLGSANNGGATADTASKPSEPQNTMAQQGFTEVDDPDEQLPF